MKILSIETSCDETGLSIVKGTGGLKNPVFKIEDEIVSSQIKIHEPWGGVVPSLAKREHLKNLPLIYEKMFGTGDKEKALWHSLDGIAVTSGPGLEPALWTGIEFAKELGKKWKKPVWGANHMEGHLFSVLLDAKAKNKISRSFPAIALIVSGGHTMLLKMTDLTHWKLLGETRDDAVGEAFDKVARLLGLPYPGGPEISRLALKGKPVISFPQPMLHSKDYDFSFSGLKTAVLYQLRDLGYGTVGMNGAKKEDQKPIPETLSADIAASFESAAVGVLRHKLFKAADEFGARSIWLSGGVAANKALRQTLSKEAKKRGLQFLVPDMKHNTDNAAMIAAAGIIGRLRKKNYPLKANGALKI